MVNPKEEVASAYGEGDTEAKSMTEAAEGGRKPVSPAKVPPPDQAVPAAGTSSAATANRPK